MGLVLMQINEPRVVGGHNVSCVRRDLLKASACWWWKISEQDEYRIRARHRSLRHSRSDFDQAVALGREKGWLVQCSEGPQLTDKGLDIARRTRVGTHRTSLD
jgi:hypothetical protein